MAGGWRVGGIEGGGWSIKTTLQKRCAYTKPDKSDCGGPLSLNKGL